MEFYLKLTILLLCILIIFLIILTIVILLHFYKNKGLSLKFSSKSSEKKESYCHNHPKKESSALCAICDHTFCDVCISTHENLHFCKAHFDLFLTNHWKQIFSVTTTPDAPEEGEELYKLKEGLWKEKSIPSYVVTHYKINFEGDFIESHVGLFCRDQDENLFKEKIND